MTPDVLASASDLPVERAPRHWLQWADRSVSLVFAVAVLAYWEFHVWYFQVEALLLPPPSKILASLVEGLSSGIFLTNLGITVYRALAGFVIATALGIGLGALIAQFRLVERTIYPWIVALQTVPKIAIAPLILVWCGYGSLSKIATAALVAFFPVLVNTITGLRNCEQSKRDLMRSLRASRWLTFRMVELPNALPFIFAGLNVAMVFSVLGALVGEFVGSKDGIGYLILDANYQLDIPRVFALLILLGLYGVVCHLALEFAQAKLVFWNQSSGMTAT